MMIFDFLEIRYLDIRWKDKSNVIQILEGDKLIEIQNSDDAFSNDFFINTVAFPQRYFYLGFHFNQELEHTPYFELLNGEKEELICFKSPHDNKDWWIQNSGWNQKTKYYNSQIYRTVGNLDLVIQNKKLKIKNNYFDFSVEELEHYLSDFKNDLWMLIVDKNNPAKAKINQQIPSFFHDESLKLLKLFVESANEILSSLNVILFEKQDILPIKKVRPIPKTFQDMVINSNRRLVTSRNYYESFDTSENRYIHYCVDRILFLITSFHKLANSQIKIFQSKIEEEKFFFNHFTNIETKVIDKNVFEEEINTLKSQITQFINPYEDFVSNIDSVEFSTNQYNNYMPSTSFKLSKSYGKAKNKFFIEKINGLPIEDFFDSNNYQGIQYGVLELDNLDVPDIDLTLFTIIIEGIFVQEFYINTKGNPFYLVKINQYVKLELDYNSNRNYRKWIENLNKLIQRKTELEKSHWIAPLSQDEKTEYKKEAKLIAGKIKLLERYSSEISNIANQFPKYIRDLKYLCNFFKDNGVKRNSNNPNSMVFIQNPRYAKCRKQFENVIRYNGISTEIFDSLMKINEINLVNTSNLYEKWCMIQTIKILKNTYGFVLQDDWQRQLIKSVLNKEYNILIKMECENTFQRIDLTFEKDILGGARRPDIVIDLYSKTIFPESVNTIEEQNQIIVNDTQKRLVLDAKFKNFTQESLDNLINELYESKNYSENGKNQVFIIHPEPRVVEKYTSPLEWGKFCDYGQSNKIDHKYGGVYLGFSLKYPNSIDNLQRLIGMFLQTNSSKFKDVDNMVWHTLHCISCGTSEKLDLNLIHGLTAGGNDKWELICNKCSQISKFTICYNYNCDNKIYKNGLKWTYHRTRAEEIFNIVCPNCESFF